MPAKPFKRKAVERLKSKRKKFRSSDNSGGNFIQKSKNKKVARFSNESGEPNSSDGSAGNFLLKSKNKKVVRFSDEREEPNSMKHAPPSSPKKKKQKKANTFENVRKKQLLEANKEEEKTIKRMEKLLKLNKKKKKKLPSSFKDEGLDYILDVIESKEGGSAILSDDEIGLEEDLAAVKETVNPKSELDLTKRPVPKQRTLTELLREKEGIKGESCSEGDEDGADIDFDDDSRSELEENLDAEEDFVGNESDEEDGEEEIEMLSDDDDEEEETEMPSNKKEKRPKIWEDIYGRLRDEFGNVVKNSEDNHSKYIPPKLRKENKNSDELENEDCLRIKKQLKGLLNRLSESNLQNICHQIEAMYMKKSRNDMNETLFSLMSELLFTPSLSPPRLIMEQAILVALLHANVGPEIGAYFLQHIVEKLGELFKKSENYGEEKECNNVLIFLSHLYNFKVTHSTLMFDVFHILIESFSSKDIELIQLLLKHIGFVLRKDDALKLKELVFSIQAKAASFNKDQNDSRVKFMLETLTAIRNNNMYKIPDYDPSIIEHSKKFLRGLIRKGCSIQELAISYEDLLKAEEKGKWWIVGSAWAESDDNDSKKLQAVKGNQLNLKTEVSEKILELARKQHMNTDVRKTIFCIIMTSEDYMDAFEKLLKLNLKNQQEREIIHVILHCALQEKNFNPFYAHLAKQFCNFARKHQICLQFALWDKFKEFSKMKPRQMKNLSGLLSFLFASGALPLSVLKVIHFSDMNKPMVRFFRQILLAILLNDDEEVCARAFTRIAKAENLKLLRESLRLFMRHFVLRGQSKLEPEVASKLEARVELSEQAMNSFKKRII
ncbi:Nucleolar MIF4G domain-containing protein 1 [Araneus ventricosus]|uniref:Nucleolar MIF4G domain-containing protein 1 n=1 Tax=Araneus ventricosus TaxID=182803 RepID=A0A4Y2FJM4_ARAVE|nr:Nucleolar MIF4G domain-containing protein 1 [Araneus ventricosus]